MVLKGGFEGYSIPIDSPLYPGPPWLYWDVEAVITLVVFKKETVEPLLPEGVSPVGGDPLGAVWIARYPTTTLGPYNEVLIAVQVEGDFGLAYYIPYIYVTNDAALAAGREVAGAPKKIASIDIRQEGSTVVGWAERGGMSIEAHVKLEYKVDEAFISGLLPEEGVPLLSLRLLPRVGESPGLAQMVLWKSKVFFNRKLGSISALGGPSKVVLRGSIEDPIDRMEIKEIVQGLYARFDMELDVDRVVREWRV